MGYAILEIVRGNREFSCYPVNAAAWALIQELSESIRRCYLGSGVK